MSSALKAQPAPPRRIEGPFTTGEVARMFAVAPRTVSKWIDSGRLRGSRLPGSLDRRVSRRHLLKFAQDHGLDVPHYLAPPRVLLVGIGAGLLPGHACLEASTAFEAGSQANEYLPTAIAVDLRATGRLEACALARAAAALPTHPFLVAVDSSPGQDAPAGFDAICRPEDLAAVLAAAGEGRP
jgi:excisionase family DNA binding protein